jgi:hypothetical protein
MRNLTRTLGPILIALSLSVVLALPASAARIITYRGETSAAKPNRVVLNVLRKDNGRRFLRNFGFIYTLTCEDASTETWVTTWGFGRDGRRLGDGGEFSFHWESPFDDLAVEATVGFRHATGTFEAASPRFTDDHQDTQICTTGPLTWTAERTGSRPARLTAANVPDGMGFMRVRVTDDVAEVVKRIEP